MTPLKPLEGVVMQPTKLPEKSKQIKERLII